MKNPFHLGWRTIAVAGTVAATILLISGCGQPANTNPPQGTDSASNANSTEQVVTLTADQLSAIKIEPVGTYRFPVEVEACGNISYDKTTDPSTKWIVADVTESTSPLVHVEQPVEVEVMAYPGRVFDGKISALGGSVWDSGGNPAVDPNVHTVIVRCEIADQKNELYPGMLASVEIQVHDPVESTAIPMNGVVRNGDGTMAAWVTTDRQRFVQRIVKVGLQKDGQWQVLEGLQKGELAVTDGAVFLSNILFAPPSD
jgi:multidrug efflux pump subunit AcrA (membrane-fusion protein)